MEIPEMPKLPSFTPIAVPIKRGFSSWVLKIFSKDYQKILNENKLLVEQVSKLTEANNKLVDNNNKMNVIIRTLSEQNKVLQSSLLCRPVSR